MTSRAPPPVVKPFVMDGVRYEPGASTGLQAADDRTAWLVATDIARGVQLWQLAIWSVVPDPAAPPNPGRYFGSIGPGPQGHELLVRDEYGASFVVDLTTRAVRELPRSAPRDALKKLLPPPPEPDA